MTTSLKKIIAAFALTSFLFLVFLSFPMMMRGADGSMPGGCPFSDMGLSLCPLDALALAVHHISSYQTFLNVTVNSAVTVFLGALFLATLVFLVLFASPPPLKIPALAEAASDSPPKDSCYRKTIRWLSLFENSPSL